MSFSKDCDLTSTFKLPCNHNSELGDRFLALKLAHNEVLHIFLCLLLQKLQLIRVYGGHFGFMLVRKNAQSVHLGIRRFLSFRTPQIIFPPKNLRVLDISGLAMDMVHLANRL